MTAVDHGEDELLERPASHIAIARQAIAEVSLDIRIGHACRRCGSTEDVIEGLHPACTPASDTGAAVEDITQIPLEQRLSTYHQLEMTTAQVAEIDPEAASKIGGAA